MTSVLPDTTTDESTVTSESTDHKELSDYWQEQVANCLWLWLSPVILLVGLGGNVCTYLVMQRPALKSSVTAIYLRMMAVMDTLILYIGLLRQWIIYLAGYDVRLSHIIVCKLHTYLLYWSMSVSVYTLVAVSCERCCMILWPIWTRRLQTRRIAIITLSIICSAAAIFYLWFPVLLEIVTYEDGTVYCNIPEQYYHWWNDIWPWIKLVVRNIIPFIIVFISTSAIFARILYLRHHRRNAFNGDEMYTLTVMLIAVSLAFLLGTTPITLYYITYKPISTLEQLAIDNLHWAIANLTNYLQFACSFPLYVITAPRFRREFLVMVRCRHVGKVGPAPRTVQFDTNATL